MEHRPTHTSAGDRALRPRAWRSLSWLLVGAAVLYAGQPMFTNDAFWHVATGSHLLGVGAFPDRDPFSFTTPDLRWVLHEWLTQVVFALVHAISGMPGLRVLTALLTAAAVVAVARLWRRELGSELAAAVGALTFLAMAHARFQTRPTLFSILAIVLVTGLCLRRGRSWRWRDGAALVAIQLVWVNLHSVALVGIALYGVFVWGEAIRAALARRDARAWPADRARPDESARAPTAVTSADRGALVRHGVTLLAAVATSLCTPAGQHLWAFAWQDKRDVMQYVEDEWGAFPTVWRDGLSLPFETWLGVLLTAAAIVAWWLTAAVLLQGERDRLRSRFLPDPGRTALMLALLAGAVTARRFHWLASLALLLCVTQFAQWRRAGAFDGLAARLRARPAARFAGAATVLLMAAFLATAGLRVGGRPLPVAVATAEYWSRAVLPEFELDGVEFLRASGIEGRVFCHYGSGGILTYRLHPAVLVFIDSRIDLYRRDVYLDYVAARDGRPDQQAILDRYGTDLYYQHWELVPPVDPSAWELLWRGAGEAVYARRGAPETPANVARARRWHAERALPAPR